MKVIEGTPQEILEYQKQSNSFVSSVRNEKVTPTALSKEFERNFLKSKYTRHYSQSKGEWVVIDEMNAAYILNILKHKLSDHTNRELIEEDAEFASLILSLADRLVEEKYK